MTGIMMKKQERGVATIVTANRKMANVITIAFLWEMVGQHGSL